MKLKTFPSVHFFDLGQIQTGHLAVEEAWIFAQPLGLTAISILFLFNNLILQFNYFF